MMRVIKQGLVFVALSMVLTSCASVTPLDPGAEKVTVMDKRPAKSCRLKGKVSASNEMRPMSTPYQHNRLKDDEFNHLKNQALKLKANVVVLSSVSGMIKERHTVSKDKHRRVGTHVFAGKAYWCPGM